MTQEKEPVDIYCPTRPLGALSALWDPLARFWVLLAKL